MIITIFIKNHVLDYTGETNDEQHKQRAAIAIDEAIRKREEEQNG